MNSAVVITISDGCYSGARKDTAGPAVGSLLAKSGWRVIRTALVPDRVDLIRAEIRSQSEPGDAALIVTTGGTGVSPYDVTPEAVRPLLEKEIPGFGELMRARGMIQTEKAALSRSLAGTRDSALVLCLPGSERGAVESLEAVLPLLAHAVDLVAGKTEHDEATEN